jgi:hypothetical protein
MIEWIDPRASASGLLVHEQLHSGSFRRHPSRSVVHVLELPGRVDMEQREGRRRGIECLARQVQHHRAVLAHGIEHHRGVQPPQPLHADVDALGLEALEMSQRRHEIEPVMSRMAAG